MAGRSSPRPRTARTPSTQALAAQPDVAVLDFPLPLMNGIEATRQIRRAAAEDRGPDLHHARQRATGRELLQAGARGYLLKSDAKDYLVRPPSRLLAATSRSSPRRSPRPCSMPTWQGRRSSSGDPDAAGARDRAAHRRGPEQQGGRAPPRHQHQDRRDASGRRHAQAQRHLDGRPRPLRHSQQARGGLERSSVALPQRRANILPHGLMPLGQSSTVPAIAGRAPPVRAAPARSDGVGDRSMVSWAGSRFGRARKAGFAVAAVAATLSACASVHGVLVPVAGTVPGASLVEMLVATTRERAGDPGEMFSGARGARRKFAEITVSIPPASVREVGEVQWPKSLPGNPATDFVTERPTWSTGPRPLTWFRQQLAKKPAAAGPRLHSRLQQPLRGRRLPLRADRARFRRATWCRSCSPGPRAAACSPTATTARAPTIRAMRWRRCCSVHRPRAGGRRDFRPRPFDGQLARPSRPLRQMAIRNGRIAPKIRNVMLAAPDVDVDSPAQQIGGPGPEPRTSPFSSRRTIARSPSRAGSGAAPPGSAPSIPSRSRTGPRSTWRRSTSSTSPS